jgi:WD40 repeat protein
MSMIRPLVRVLVFCASASRACMAQDSDLPPRDPILQIEAGMHTAVVRRIAADPSCSLAVTGSEDKTVRLWHLPDGKLMKVLHPPIGPGNDGKVYAVALAPKGEWIAAGGFSRTPGYHFIYLFDGSTGSMVRSFGPFPQVVEHLTASVDGRFLAATFRGGLGARVWRRSGSELGSWQLALDDREYGGRDSTGAAFDREGALYTVGYDRRLRRYAPGFERKTAQIVAGLQPHSISVHPSEGLVAIGYGDVGRIDVYDAASLNRLYPLEADPAGTGALSSVAWSADGQSLYAGGSFTIARDVVLQVWGNKGTGDRRTIAGSRDAVTNLFPCGSGVAVAAADPAFGLVDPNGARRLWLESAGADMRGKLQGDFTVSEDGLRVRFGLRAGGQDPVLLDMLAGSLTDSPTKPDDLFPPNDESLPITNWKSTTAPRLEGNALDLTPRERSQSVAITPERDGFVLGTDYFLRSYDKSGALLWQSQAPGVVWGVNIARQRGLVVAACGDGTLRWYRLSDGTLLLSMFVQRTDRRWIAWTPDGYFTTSVGGEELIGWSVNRAWNQSADFFPASQFRKTFYRPDIVQRVLAAAERSNDPAAAGEVLTHRPPVARIVSPSARSVATSNEITVTYIIRSPTGAPVKKLTLFVDGILANAQSNSDLWIMNSDGEFTGTMKVKIPSRDVEISLVAETGDTASEPARSTLLWWKPQTDAAAVKPNLYAVLIGASDYDDKSLALPSPGNDVDDFDLLLNRQANKAFGKIKVVKLKDRGPEPATKQNIIEKLIWLKNQVQAPEDIALVYFSGHGKNLPGGIGSYLLPVDYDGEPSRSGISKASLFEILRQVNGGLILFVDACYAANGLDTVDFLNETSSWQTIRVMTYASSNRAETSLTKGRNSFFTSALVDAFGGNAPHQGNSLRTDELGVWLATSVPRLASPGRQTPQTSKSPAWQHIPIAYD